MREYGIATARLDRSCPRAARTRGCSRSPAVRTIPRADQAPNCRSVLAITVHFGHPALVKLSGRRQARGEVECVLRVVEGEFPGLGGTWRHGIGTLSPGHIRFTPRLWQLRMKRPFTDAIDIEIASVKSEAPDPRARDIWSVGPNLLMATIETGNARLVWGVPEKDAAWAHARVA